MKSFSLGAAWEETIALLRREHALLVPVALALFGPAQIMIELGVPHEMPAAGTGPAPGGALLLVFPAMILVFLANLAITRLALIPGISVAEALSSGLRRLPRALGATLLLGAAVMGIGIVIVTGATIGILSFGGDPRSPTMASQLVVLVMIPVLVLLVPSVAMEDRGTIDSIRRGWALGKGIALRLAAMLALLLLLTMVVQLIETFVVGSLFQLLALATDQGELAKILHMLVNAAIDSLLSLGFTVYVALAYRAVAARVA